MAKDSSDSSSPQNTSVRTIPRDTDPANFPKALAARVGDRDLWIANIGAIRSNHLAAMDLDPAFVVTVNDTATWATTDHHPLKDGHINAQDKFSAAVEATRRNIRAEGTVVVNCSAGISRSATVIATAIAAEETISLEAAIEAIQATRPRANPHPKLQLNAYAYLAVAADRPAAREKLDELAGSSAIRVDKETILEELLPEN